MFYKHVTTVGMTKHNDRFDAAEDQFNHLAVQCNSELKMAICAIICIYSGVSHKSESFQMASYHVSYINLTSPCFSGLTPRLTLNSVSKLQHWHQHSSDSIKLVIDDIISIV